MHLTLIFDQLELVHETLIIYALFSSLFVILVGTEVNVYSEFIFSLDCAYMHE